MIVIWDLDVVISQLITVTIKVAEPAANHDEVRPIFLIDQGHEAVTRHDQDVENYDHGADQARGDQLLAPGKSHSRSSLATRSIGNQEY